MIDLSSDAGLENGDRPLLRFVRAHDWPFNGKDLRTVDFNFREGDVGVVGGVTSVAVDAEGCVLVLHRGPRVWEDL